MIWNVLYVSSASYPLTREDLERLLTDARAWNKGHDVTGILLHCGGNFMQLLEGPQESVLRTFARVVASSQHHTVTELLNGPASGRIFGEWAMADSQVNPERFQDMLRLADQRQIQPQVLRTFWETNR